MKTFTVEQVAEHNSAKDCWIIVDGKVFDVTNFLADHPGGKKVIVKVAGKDATKQFHSFHNDAIMQKVGLPLQVGVIGSAKDNQQEKKQPAAAAASSPTATPAPVTGQLVSSDLSHFGEGVPYGDPTWYQDWNSPYYNESHIKLRKVIREWVDKSIMPYCHEWSEAKQIPKSVYQEAAKLGFLAAVTGAPSSKDTAALMPYPLAAGIKPEEFDIFHEFICVDELSRCGSGGLIWAIQGGLAIGLPPVMHFATPEVKKKVVTGCLSGEKYIALAITEPSAGSDVANLETTAVDQGDHFIVNGEKKWITQGLYADYFTVACRTGGEGMGGVSLMVIERDFPGVSVRAMDCQGMWGSGTSYITFEDVRVPKSHLIGKLNQGFKYIMHNFNHERLGIIMQANRLARVCIEESLKYSTKRKTFGQRLIDHAVIRNKFGHMIRQCEATHAWLENILYQVKTLPAEVQPARLGGPIALLKAQSTQTFEYCAREAAQIYGGLAYTRGGQGEKIERLYREVRAFAIPGGSEEIMLDLGVRQALKQYTTKQKL
ncbi:acyl-CoA dehydrogenase/oxidase [Radiomyces spectabilis]|uniref:acyl-CoA dehydrogenase/oxidase n=1 Tax=Radiomyces spectabilis TaxID=64574 RepID=UPI00221E4613|nr:acyl-CoA dehydrogenase/oxidase [Radiomyces spectabilis]KAI8376143.1 acyl-CoA dehydrogenase/oxidase [Radiomyces spectabilis]